MTRDLLPLHDLRKQYIADLFDEYLPFLEKHVIDHELGGFLCHTTPFGERVSDVKRIWYQGRGIWIYSFLHNEFLREQQYLDIAARTVDLLMKSKPNGEDQMWPVQIDRDGRPLGPPDGEIYGDLFIAEGLVEFHRATGDDRWWNLALEIIRKCVRAYDRPEYHPAVGETYSSGGAKPFPGARILGAWMVLLRLATQILQIRPNAEMEQLADRCLDAIMNRHFNPRFRLINELMRHDLDRPDDHHEQFVCAGHVIETCWMVMHEALRRRDSALFDTAAERFRRHSEAAWDRIYGGLFCNLRHVDDNIWDTQKILFPQQEFLVGALMLVEHRADKWAASAFTELNSWAHEKYPLKKYGSPIWQITGNRQVDFMPDATRVENYHHPRFLMLNLLAMDRMLTGAA
jgi:mannose/cellobiose epimerase-like protein (N-acyl-D-glucosamine 2-epimerase family)